MKYSFLCIGVVIWGVGSGLSAQQIQVSGPLSSAGSSFHENFGVNFGFGFGGGGMSRQAPGVTFSQNNAVRPAFGGFDPNSGARFGFSNRNGDGGGFSLGFNFSEGNSRILNSVSPSITIPNGGFGSLTAGRFSPFVTGVIPVVGTDNAVTRAVASGQLKPYIPSRTERSRSTPSNATSSDTSTATTSDASVAHIKAERQQAEQLRAQSFEQAVAAAKLAERERDYPNIRRNIRRALKSTDDPVKTRELRLWMKEFRGKH